MTVKVEDATTNQEEGGGGLLKLNLKFNLNKKQGGGGEGSHAVDKRYDASNNPSKMSINNNDNTSLSPPVSIRDIKDGPAKQENTAKGN